MHHDFSIEDLFAYLHERTGINRSSLSWYLFKLVDDNALVRIGRGIYGKVVKQSFSPEPIDEVKRYMNCYKQISRLPDFVSIKVKSSHRYNIIFLPIV